MCGTGEGDADDTGPFSGVRAARCLVACVFCRRADLTFLASRSRRDFGFVEEFRIGDLIGMYSLAVGFKLDVLSAGNGPSPAMHP